MCPVAARIRTTAKNTAHARIKRPHAHTARLRSNAVLIANFCLSSPPSSPFLTRTNQRLSGLRRRPMGHVFLILVVALVLASARATASFAEVSGSVPTEQVCSWFFFPEVSDVGSLVAGAEHCGNPRRDRVEAAELRGAVPLLRALRGRAGARLPAEAAAEEARPWNQSCRCCAGFLRRPLQLQAPELEVQVRPAHLGALRRRSDFN